MIAYIVISTLYFVTLGVLASPRVIKDKQVRMYTIAYTLMGGIIVWALSAIVYIGLTARPGSGMVGI